MKCTLRTLLAIANQLPTNILTSSGVTPIFYIVFVKAKYNFQYFSNITDWMTIFMDYIKNSDKTSRKLRFLTFNIFSRVKLGSF